MTRDRTAKPEKGLYNICYINGFQAQPGEEDVAFWKKQHPELILRDAAGKIVVDEDWNEIILDIRTPDLRKKLS